jgi:predicted nucleic acid-binding protein
VIVYVESSAAVKLLVREAETTALVAFLDRAAEVPDTYLVSSTILETELRRVAVRGELAQRDVTVVLDHFDIVDLDRSVFTSAGTLPGRNLGSLDALHIAAALKADADVMLSYDARQIFAAEEVGLRALSPA